MHTHTHTHTYARTHTHTRIHTHACTCMHVHARTRAHTTYTHLHPPILKGYKSELLIYKYMLYQEHILLVILLCKLLYSQLVEGGPALAPVKHLPLFHSLDLISFMICPRTHITHVQHVNVYIHVYMYLYFLSSHNESASFSETSQLNHSIPSGTTNTTPHVCVWGGGACRSVHDNGILYKFYLRI